MGDKWNKKQHKVKSQANTSHQNSFPDFNFTSLWNCTGMINTILLKDMSSVGVGDVSPKSFISVQLG